MGLGTTIPGPVLFVGPSLFDLPSFAGIASYKSVPHNQPMTRHTLSVRSDYRVVGYDGEFADMSNPQGAIIREVFFLLATDTDGNRLAYGSFDSEDAALTSIPDAPPVSTWAPTEPEYGSLAFQRYGQDDLIAWEARHLEMESWGYDDYLAVA